MDQQPAREALGTAPFWRVQSVFDPDGGGKDFAYTIGLHERGLPELHIWGRPSLGDDPGHDWMFSTRDRCIVLNHLAQMLVDGGLAVGSQITKEYDEGHARVTFRVDPPGDREELEAYGVPPGVDVLPVRWSLHRAPEGPLTPLAQDWENQARVWFEEMMEGLDIGAAGRLGWKLPKQPRFDEGQRFGPLTPLVLARAAQLWQADDKTLLDLLDTGATVEMGFSITESVSMAFAFARPVGRRRHLENLHHAVHELVDGLTDGSPPQRRRWRALVRSWDQEMWETLDRQGRARLSRNLAHLLHDLAASCLMVEAVADQAPESLLLQARGPWLAGLRHEAVLSHPDWRAAPAVLERLHELLDPLGAETLTLLGNLHRFACERQVIGAEDYQSLYCRLTSWALTSAASCPWDPVLKELPGWRRLLEALPGAAIAHMWELESWATCIASALTHRARLSADEVHTLAVPFEEDLPRLEEVLNTPV